MNPFGLSRTLLNSLPPPAPDFRWRVQMPDAPDAVGNNVVPFPFPVPSGSQGQVIVENITWPFLTIDTRPRFGGGTNRHFPEWNNVTGLNITFYEDCKLSVTQYLRKWTRSTVHDNGDYGLPVDYKRDIILYLYGWYNDTTPVLTPTVHGCWPSQRNSFDLNYTNAGRLVVGCQFSCDNQPEYDPNSSTTASSTTYSS